MVSGGYYLTSLYSALFYISTFRPRLAARQLSVEAQQSLSQWHRRRTLHCNQSRRGSHRRTIRRHAGPKTEPKGPPGQDSPVPPAGGDETLQVINESAADVAERDQSDHHTQPRDGEPSVGDRGAVASGTGSSAGARQEPLGRTEEGLEGSSLPRAPEVLWSKTVVEEEEGDTEGESSSEAED